MGWPPSPAHILNHKSRLLGIPYDSISSESALAPYEFQEVCFDLAPQDEVQYDFRSDQPIDFDIHYHDGLRIRFPVKLTGITVHADRFVAELDQTYCLMWFNQNLAGTLLNYRTSGP